MLFILKLVKKYCEVHRNVTPQFGCVSKLLFILEKQHGTRFYHFTFLDRVTDAKTHKMRKISVAGEIRQTNEGEKYRQQTVRRFVSSKRNSPLIQTRTEPRELEY